MSARGITQRRPRHTQDVAAKEHTFVLPWMDTASTGPAAYNTGVHAAIHSLFNALQLVSGGPSSSPPAKPAKFTKRDVGYWLAAAQEQVTEACRQFCVKGARLTREPARRKKP